MLNLKEQNWSKWLVEQSKSNFVGFSISILFNDMQRNMTSFIDSSLKTN